MNVGKAMVFSMAVSLAFAVGPKILFVGNSHTQFGDVPGMVQRLLSSDKEFVGVAYQSFGVGVLNQWRGNSGLIKTLKNEKYDYAVLQGAEVSSSHKYVYSQKEGIELAAGLEKMGIRVLLVSEWPRRGWDEAEYTEAVYRGMAKESGAEVIPVGRVWDGVRKRLNGIDLWQADGNHALPKGSYLSARTIARWLGGQRLNYVLEGVDKEFVAAIDEEFLDLEK